MRRNFSILLLMFIAFSSFAQSPHGFSYQAVVRDSKGDLLQDKTIKLRVSVVQSSPQGTKVYSETHTPKTNNNGLVTVEIGAGTAIEGSFNTIDWSVADYYVKSEIDVQGGNSFTLNATTKLLSVPYALYAYKSKESTTDYTHYVGEEFGGGVVFAVWKDKAGEEHGLIVAKQDNAEKNTWSNIIALEIGASAQSSWNGYDNTLAITAQPEHEVSAASVCNQFAYQGFSDWYLPSIDELNLLWSNRFYVNKALNAMQQGQEISMKYNYWSSTEYSAGNAFQFSFINGNATVSAKHSTFAIRAIRRF